MRGRKTAFILGDSALDLYRQLLARGSLSETMYCRRAADVAILVERGFARVDAHARLVPESTPTMLAALAECGRRSMHSALSEYNDQLLRFADRLTRPYRGSLGAGHTVATNAAGLPRRWTTLDVVASPHVLAWLAEEVSIDSHARIICDLDALTSGYALTAIESLVERGTGVRMSGRKLVPMAVLNGSRVFAWPATRGAPATIEQAQIAAIFSEVFTVLWHSADEAPAPEWSTGLTAHQRRVLQMLRLGLSDDEISAAVGTSAQAVRVHIASLMDVLQVKTRFSAGVAAAALERRG